MRYKINGHHIYQGGCPDELDPYSRDENCQACKALIFAEKIAAAMKHISSSPTDVLFFIQLAYGDISWDEAMQILDFNQ
jgi:hypothetical protein